jgi:DNA-3-methyladenine glycosylase
VVRHSVNVVALRAHKPLPRKFYDRQSLDVARDLLGCVVTAGGVSIRLTEVEAYDGGNDPASHAFRGPTPRNAVMFGPPGHVYVYFTYGMHFCMNLVCAQPGTAAAVLLRAGEVVGGVDVASERRLNARPRDLARGPARLCVALSVDRTLDGADVTKARSPITVSEAEPVPDALVRTGPRVGISVATDWPYRLWIDGDPTVSPYRPAKPRRR